ncbi:MAG: chemotaxis protein CheW [Oscillospiraceae bacterium]|jgi:purine-binding chemotaxis protein CheW|nr:chemotaxis protein CheW [Oscillospiraceae bacterium]
MEEVLIDQVTDTFAEDGGEILLFFVNEVLYGIDIRFITEIIGIQPITIVPLVPSYIKGVINIRGKVVPVISARRKFGLPEIDYDEKTCIIVVEVNETPVGIIVDMVRAVQSVMPGDICSSPGAGTVNPSDQYVSTIIESDGEIKLLLDIHKLVLE